MAKWKASKGKKGKEKLAAKTCLLLGLMPDSPLPEGHNLFAHFTVTPSNKKGVLFEPSTCGYDGELPPTIHYAASQSSRVKEP